MFGIIVGVSVILQFVAVFLSLRIIKITGQWKVWGLISLALMVIGVRSALTLFRLIVGEVSSSTDLIAALLVLIISALMIVGVYFYGLNYASITALTKTLKQRESQLIDAQRIANLAIIEFDFSDNSVWWSNELYLRYGYNKAEFSPNYANVFDFVHEADRDTVKGVIERYRRSELSEPLELDYRTLGNGDVEICIHALVTSEKDRTGQIIRCRIVSQDITGRKRVEDELKSREEQLKLVMSVNDDGWYDWDIAKKQIYFDPRYYTMAGYQPNEYPSAYEEWVKRVHPDDIAKTEKASSAFVVGETSEYDEEFRFKRKDGEWMWIRSRTKIISRDDRGTPLRVVGTHTDITEKTIAEDKLKKNEEQLQLVMSVNNDGWYDWDGPANSIYFDPRFFTIAGYEPNDFPHTFEEAVKRIHPTDYLEMEKVLRAFVAGELSSYDEEFRFRRNDGDWMWLRSKIKTVSLNNCA